MIKFANSNLNYFFRIKIKNCSVMLTNRFTVFSVIFTKSIRVGEISVGPCQEALLYKQSTGQKEDFFKIKRFI